MSVYLRRLMQNTPRTERSVPGTATPAAVDRRMLQILQSLRRAAWFIVCLLALIFIVTLSRR